MMGNQPILLLKEDTERERGRDAQKNNIAAAKAVADAVRTTLGPKGMDKMLVDSLGDVVITNDGATILDEIDIEHPAAKMAVEMAESQDDECGDGTTTVVVLAGELLKNAEELIEQNVHPSVIAKGFRLASMKAREILEESKIELDIEDEEKLREIAMTAMTGKAIEGEKERLAELAVDAVRHVAEKEDGSYSVDIDNVKVEKKAGAGVDNTEMINGVLLDKERLHENMPTEVKDAKIALLNSALEIK
ncbi:MAG: TCP-1/cpn60 chaperonin family protein, partial [Candidatus Aenigmatarchaeota archaeon]